MSSIDDDYLCSLKTDGCRYLLILTLREDGSPVSVCIDRSLNMYEIEIWGPEHFFTNGTLFDGELVWKQPNEDQLHFMLFDVMCISGQLTTTHKYEDRLLRIMQTISHNSTVTKTTELELIEEDKILAVNNMFNLALVSKRCVRLENVDKLWDSRFQEGHRNDGIILTSNAAPIRTGSTDSILKWKPVHSIDVAMDSERKIFVNANKTSSLVPLSDHTSMTCNLIQNEIIDSLREHTIVECIIEVTYDILNIFPIRQRFDKKGANSVHTVQQTILNAKENIILEELKGRGSKTSGSQYLR